MENMLKSAEQMELQLQSENLEGVPSLEQTSVAAAGTSGTTEAAAPSSSKSTSTQLSDLPDICIAMMLACLNPIEVVKLACVCRSFYDASHSDLVWETFLPPSYHNLLALQPNPPPEFASKKEVFDHLCKPFVTSNRIQGYWLDRRTGGLSMSLSASGLVIVWSDNDRYWEWLEDRASMFPLVAELRNVCWFEARGEIECTLPPGAYTLSWRIRFLDTFVGWADEPAHFKFSKNNGTEMEFKCYIQQQLPPVQVPGYSSPTFRQVEGEWRELDAGEFVVETGEEMTLLQFCMLEITGGRWKRGLRLDGVLVRPTNTLAPSLPSSPATNAAQLTRLLPRHLPHSRRFPMDLPGTFQVART